MTESPFAGSIVLGVNAHDLDAARNFYAACLGFTVDMDVWLGEGAVHNPVRRLRMIFEANPAVALEFFAADSKPVADGDAVPYLTLSVTDARAANERIARDWPNSIVPFDETPFGAFLTLRDPHGNLIQLAELFVAAE